MRERRGVRARWMGEWGEGERWGKGWMDGGVALGKEEGAGLDGMGSEVRERGGGKTGWMGEWGEGERRKRDWMDAGVR